MGGGTRDLLGNMVLSYPMWRRDHATAQHAEFLSLHFEVDYDADDPGDEGDSFANCDRSGDTA